MRRILLTIIALLTIVATASAQEPTQATISVDRHNICLGDVVVINDATVSPAITARRWTLETSHGDSIINGTSQGEQLSIIMHDFRQEANPIELMVVLTLPDTIVTTVVDSFTVMGPSDTLFHTHNDSTFTSRYDSIYAYDTVYVFLHPKMHATGDSVVCGSSDEVNIKMEPTVNGVSYSWFRDTTATPIAYGSRLTTTLEKSVETFFLHIEDSHGCVVWDSTNAYIMQNDLQTLPADGRICAGDTAFLIAGKADHYLWEAMPADTLLDSQQYNGYVAVAPINSTLYCMTPYGSNGCAGERKCATITVFPLPKIEISISPKVIDPENPVMTLTDNSENRDKSFWSFGIADYAEGQTVEHNFGDIMQDSTEIVLTTENSIGCRVDTAFLVPVQRFASWAPSFFTPNRSENSDFRIQTINEVDYFSVMIFNREGMLVFSSTERDFVWDGTHKGKDCPQGTYVYLCKYRRANTDNVTQMKGVVTLLR